MAALMSARPMSLSLKATKPAQIGSITSSFRGLSLAKPAVAQVAVAKAAFTVEAKNKLKTKKAAAKRFKVTAGGKVMARHAMKGHLLGKKSPKKKRQLSNELAVDDGDYNNVISMLPYAGVKKQGGK
mmetsp:Transcript_28701/g.91578  ORF Transcript_28701/g.91578 Transcript_28701/m.91578 type:complete len:127 (-) Transcript_28701:621-1001(-)